jgi:hypothetical protein
MNDTQTFQLRRRPFWQRVRNHYGIYRRVGMGRLKSAWTALRIARMRGATIMDAAAIAIGNRLADAKDKRIADLEAMASEMVKSIPGGQYCDPQEVADTLREIARRHGVEVKD